MTELNCQALHVLGTDRSVQWPGQTHRESAFFLTKKTKKLGSDHHASPGSMNGCYRPWPLTPQLSEGVPAASRCDMSQSILVASCL